MNGGYTGNKYPLYVSLSGQLIYWRHDNNIIPEHMKYNTQFWNDTTIQTFMWGDSLELKWENNKGSGSEGLHVKNQVTINY